MPGIPVHTSSPISTRPLHPDGLTPSTSTGVGDGTSQGPTPTSTVPTSTSNTTAARPGQPAIPAPTSSVPTPATYPTRTTVPPTTSSFNSPPPPQPGPTPSAYPPFSSSQQPSFNPSPANPWLHSSSSLIPAHTNIHFNRPSNLRRPLRPPTISPHPNQHTHTCPTARKHDLDLTRPLPPTRLHPKRRCRVPGTSHRTVPAI